MESTQGTWLTGTAFEHNTLYNYNLHAAAKVFVGMQQSETPYWQGEGSANNAPDPWTPDERYGDPDFSWCDAGDARCRMSLAQNIDGGSQMHIYGSGKCAPRTILNPVVSSPRSSADTRYPAGFCTFFNAMNDNNWSSAPCPDSAVCITNQARVAGDPAGLYCCSGNTKGADVMVLDGSDPKHHNNPGGWGGIIAAYLSFAGEGE